MNCLHFGILLAYALLALPAPSDAYIARSTGCHHNGTWYADKSLVPTVEKCLNCQCNKKTLVCRLKVCPEMPMPPPRGCVVVQKKHTCCPYLSCARAEAFYKIPITRRIIAYLDHYERESIDRVVNDNMLQRRSDDSEIDLLVCVKNGTVYKSGSAMSSSNLCSYCYCIGGQEKCVKPKCMLPVEGCKPIFVDSTCCPVRYDCSAKTSGKSSQEVRYRKTANKHFLRMSQRQQRNRGCTVNKQFYAEGQKMKSDPDKPCDICFCIRGARRCAPKKCSPPLKNCIPVVPKGQCCPSSYDCGSQRDYRRAQNSRQFNLFSLLFGKDEVKTNPSTPIPVEYPHDRDPALVDGPNKLKTHEQALPSSSEKSILDTIREGLEFIDGNTNHMLEENLDLVNLQAKRESVPELENSTTIAPAVEANSTTELSFLDLILGETSELPQDNNETRNVLQSTPASDELSWVDILLGPEEMHGNSTVDDQVVSSSEAFNTAVNIDRIDADVDEIGSSGEIIVDSTEGATTETLNVSFTTTTSVQSTTETAFNKTDNEHKMPAKPQPSTIKPIPLHESSEPPQQIEYIPIKEIKPISTNEQTTDEPIEKSDLLAAFLDGISEILNPENSVNSSSSTNITNKEVTTTQPTTVTSSALPIFKPLPTQKSQPHIRINSKIANLIVSSPKPFASAQKAQNTTFKPLPKTNSKPTTTTTTTTTTAPPSTSTSRSTTTTTTASTTTTTSTTPMTTTTRKPQPTTTLTTTPKPLIINTNPTILEAEPLDDSTKPTLPPSLPNLKIIPFLPTDAVEAAITKVYEYFPGNAQPFEDAMSKTYGGYAVDLDDDNKAKYIYKFKVEGPEADVGIPEVIPKPPPPPVDTLSVDTFSKYDFAEKNGFSPPTKTEGGFMPKEPLPIDDEVLISGEFNVSKLNEIFPATMHVIDLTTSAPISDNLTKIIEITTPDPFKDVIHTEPPPDLALIIQDKVKIEALAEKSINSSLKSGQEAKQQPSLNISSPNVPANEAIAAKNKTTIEIILEQLLKEKSSTSTSTIPPFKSLPTTKAHSSIINSTIATTINKKVTSASYSRRPIRTKSTQTVGSKNRTKPHATRRPTAQLPTKDNKIKMHKSPSKSSTSTTTAPPTSSSVPFSSQKPTKSITITTTSTTKTTTIKPTTIKTTQTPTQQTTTTVASSIKTTHNPFLMSPFDKLPFMDQSFDIKRKKQQQTDLANPTSHYSSWERLEGLNAAYDISNAISSSNSIAANSTTTTTTTTTASTTTIVHPQYSPASEKQHSSTNNLIDPIGILKLAGCNIYGRMYRVGRIILELSSPCVECKCTETGVKCGELDC